MQHSFSTAEVVILVGLVLAIYTALLLLLGWVGERSRGRKRELVEVERVEAGRSAFAVPPAEVNVSAWKVVLARLAVEDLLPSDSQGLYRAETGRFMLSISDYEGGAGVESACMAAGSLLREGRAHYPSVDGLSDPTPIEVARVGRCMADYLDQTFAASPSGPSSESEGWAR